MKINKIYNENCLETMSRMDDEFIDLTVTSPPYDNLRTYNDDIDKNWGEHVWKPVIKELYRVTKDGGVVVWIVGDATIDGSETGTSFRQALYAIKCGFRLHDTMIFEKNGSSFPARRNSNRYTQIFEYMFVFSKNSPTSNLICDKKNRWEGYSSFGKSTYYNTKGNLIERKQKPTPKLSPRNNIWRYNTGKGYSTKDELSHPAIFPEKLAYDHIRSWSNKGDLVYDPFMGSGTTAKASICLERNYIGSEISKDYCNIIDKRLQPLQNNLFSTINNNL